MTRHHLLRTWLPALLLAAATAHAQETWTLDRCLDAAVETSGRLTASRERGIAAEQAADRAHAGRLPSLGLNGKADYINKTMSLNLDIPPNPIFTAPDIQFGDGKNYDIALALSAPLFTGGSLKELEQAQRNEVDARLLDISADSLSLLYEVRGAFYRALAAEAAKASAIQASDRLNRHLKEIEGLIDAGAAVEEARISALARLKDVQKGVIEADTRLHAARLDLGRLTGHSGEEVVPLGDLDAALIGADSLQTDRISDRPDLQALSARGDGIRKQASAAKGAFWPTVSAQAAYHYGKPGIDQITNEWMDYATVGVRMSWTLFDWGARRNSVQQAEASARAIEASRRDALSAYQSRLHTALRRLDAARTQRDLSSEQGDLERSRLALIANRYKKGMATENERLDVEDDLTSAELTLVASEANERLAEVDLLFILGR